MTTFKRRRPGRDNGEGGMAAQRAEDDLMALVGISLVVCGFICSVAVTRVAADTSAAVATVEQIQAGAMIRQVGASGFSRLTQGQPVYVQDVVATNVDRSSRIWLRGQTPINMGVSLGSRTVFGFAKCEISGHASACLGQLSRGAARFIKLLPKTAPPSSFMIITPTALIEVTPDGEKADFVVEAPSPTRTVITRFWGDVRVKNIDPRLRRAMHMTSCRQAVVEQNQEPFSPSTMPTDAARRLVGLTTISGTVLTDPPICEGDATGTVPLIDASEDRSIVLPPPGIFFLPPGIIDQSENPHTPTYIPFFVPIEVPEYVPSNSNPPVTEHQPAGQQPQPSRMDLWPYGGESGHSRVPDQSRPGSRLDGSVGGGGRIK